MITDRLSARALARTLRATEIAAAVAVGILVGRACTVLTAPEPEPRAWRFQAADGGRLVGPLILSDEHGRTFLRLPAGKTLQPGDDMGFILSCEGGPPCVWTAAEPTEVSSLGR